MCLLPLVFNAVKVLSLDISRWDMYLAHTEAKGNQ